MKLSNKTHKRKISTLSLIILLTALFNPASAIDGEYYSTGIFIFNFQNSNPSFIAGCTNESASFFTTAINWNKIIEFDDSLNNNLIYDPNDTKLGEINIDDITFSSNVSNIMSGSNEGVKYQFIGESPNSIELNADIRFEYFHYEDDEPIDYGDNDFILKAGYLKSNFFLENFSPDTSTSMIFVEKELQVNLTDTLFTGDEDIGISPTTNNAFINVSLTEPDSDYMGIVQLFSPLTVKIDESFTNITINLIKTSSFPNLKILIQYNFPHINTDLFYDNGLIVNWIKEAACFWCYFNLNDLKDDSECLAGEPSSSSSSSSSEEEGVFPILPFLFALIMISLFVFIRKLKINY